MIVRILSSGKSFSGLSNYLTHDPEANTSERVGWTHTQNLANDHVPSAIDEMVWTARDAELLKQEAGIRAGGRATENTVKHFSLNWSPEDDPAREHMIATTEDFLRHMNWQDHQAVFVAHTDKSYAHVHCMLNTVHPVTGLALDDGFERRRAQAWALNYELENEMVYCGQRLMRPEEREAALTRDAWMAFQDRQKSFEREEKARLQNFNAAENTKNANNLKNAYAAEWNQLKEFQRDDREAFFAGGKSAFAAVRSSVYLEVKEEFRDRWNEYYSGRKNGADIDELAATKAQLVADQKAMLETRRDEACGALRETRDGLYRTLLGGQRDIRAELRERQEAGLDSADYVRDLESSYAPLSATAEFREAAHNLTARQSFGGGGRDHAASRDGAEIEDRSTGDIGSGAGIGAGLRFCSLFDSLLAEFEGTPLHTAPPRDRSSEAFEAAAAEAGKRQQREREQAEEDDRRRQRSLAGE